MNVETVTQLRFDPPASRLLRRGFVALWLVDLISTILFFTVPYASELNPVTVFFYGVFGLPGVALAALCYAGVIVVVGTLLSAPTDVRFLGVMTALYATFALNNVFLLLFRVPLVEQLVY